MIELVVLDDAFPTAVGMNRPNGKPENRRGRVPHSRGDEPPLVPPLIRIVTRSPQPWG